MYVKVHKEGNQWFRDNGTLVGKEISRDSYCYKKISSILGEQIFIEKDNKIVTVVCQGYLDVTGKLHRLRAYEKCPNQTRGFYIFD